tara:strand:- start:191 stop:325 length:135 start_codon:yes stop_codon:yes gene_type:complete
VETTLVYREEVKIRSYKIGEEAKEFNKNSDNRIDAEISRRYRGP